MAALAALGPTFTDLWLNAIFRGTVGTPPSTVYFSLGSTNSVTVPAEITTTRTPVRINRGWINGTDTVVYPYESTGNTVSTLNVHGDPIHIYCTGLGSNQYDNPCVLVYDAASAGNLLAVLEPSWGSVSQVINGDVVQVNRPYYDVTGTGEPYTVSVPGTGSGNHSIFLSRAASGTAGSLGAYPYAMLVDWLLRGYDSINTKFPVGTYANVYAAFFTSGGTEITAIPRLGIPRNTSTWNAPADANPGTNLERKIVNSVDFDFSAATAGGSYASGVRLDFRMSNVAQAFDDLLYRIVIGALNFSSGDVIQFAAGDLEIVLN